MSDLQIEEDVLNEAVCGAPRGKWEERGFYVAAREAQRLSESVEVLEFLGA